LYELSEILIFDTIIYLEYIGKILPPGKKRCKLMTLGRKSKKRGKSKRGKQEMKRRKRKKKKKKGS
jgi:hypothetical protein